MKTSIITGVNGQDGSYLAEFLLKKSYTVYGTIRRSSSNNLDKLAKVIDHPSFHLVYSDLSDGSAVMALVNDVLLKHKGHVEIYNLGAQSHVGVSFELPVYTSIVDAIGPLHFLEAIRKLDRDKRCRFYQASTSELYGKVVETPQHELTPFNAQSPYAIAKLYAFHITKLYREAYGMFACNGILFNHESERRGPEFLTRKVTLGVAAISKGEKDCIEVGNLDAKRDWGYAPEYVEMMWLILNHSEPEDFVAATGQTQTVRRCIEVAFKVTGVTIVWEGEGVDEIGKDVETGIVRVKVNPVYFRAAEVELLLGNPAKAEKVLGWRPRLTFEEIIEKMVIHDLELESVEK